MSSEMREYVAALRDREHRFHGMGGHYVAEVIRGELEAILARTEAGADGAVAWILRTGHGTALHEGPRPPVEGVGWKPMFDRPQDASGDAEDTRRYRWLRDHASRAQLEMFADRRGTRLAADRLCDAGIDIAMQAKEAK